MECQEAIAREESSPQETLKFASPLRLRFVAMLFSDEIRFFVLDRPLTQHQGGEPCDKPLDILQRKEESASPQRQLTRSAFTLAAASVKFFGGTGRR